LIPDDFDQAATSFVTEAVSAGPLEPIITVSSADLSWVRAPLVLVVLELPNPDPQALRARAATMASPVPALQRMMRLCMSFS
jgi:hypothetical protein